MAWTAPRTWVSGEVVTASVMNSHVRDNFLETGPAKASASGGFIMSTGANTLTERQISGDEVSTSETTTSTSYTDLATSGPAATVTTGTRVVVVLTAAVSGNSASMQMFMSTAISGATTQSASDNYALASETNASGDTMVFQGSQLTRFTTTAGSNTFTAKYRVTAGTGTWVNRRMIIIPAQ